MSPGLDNRVLTRLPASPAAARSSLTDCGRADMFNDTTKLLPSGATRA